ncbi:MAG: UDP-N-acetylglucosamine 1-carboxyvinyltransferase [Pseudomonadota bacterium]
MDSIRIQGNGPLKGAIRVSGAKNAALPLMIASLLTDEPLVLENTPDLADIRLLCEILAQHGVTATRDGASLTLTAARITNTLAPYDLVRKMRASFLVAGGLLARCRTARVSLPGGCAIGTRPVDMHLEGFRALGAEIDLRDGYVDLRAPAGLVGAEVTFPFASVGATENIMLAAALAKGETVIRNAAREPEIMDLADCLSAMGATIEGAGESSIHIQGAERLTGATHSVIPDRIETGTYAMAVGIAGGELLLERARGDLIAGVIPILRDVGVLVREVPEGLSVTRENGRPLSIDVMTEPFPGFPTDLQAQFMAMMATAKGVSRITETIFENRFMHVPELMRMGADIHVEGQTATITGVPKLKGAPVMATDLRASVSLVLAGLGADGETLVNRVYHLDRGFERIEDKLGRVGAIIERVHEPK